MTYDLEELRRLEAESGDELMPPWAEQLQWDGEITSEDGTVGEINSPSQRALVIALRNAAPELLARMAKLEAAATAAPPKDSGMSANEGSAPWQAGAVGRNPQDDALVWRNDAVSGPHFYAAGPADAERATVLLNALEARIAELELALIEDVSEERSRRLDVEKRIAELEDSYRRQGALNGTLTRNMADVREEAEKRAVAAEKRSRELEAELEAVVVAAVLVTHAGDSETLALSVKVLTNALAAVLPQRGTPRGVAIGVNDRDAKSLVHDDTVASHRLIRENALREAANACDPGETGLDGRAYARRIIALIDSPEVKP
jgi:hypothetical protein